MINHTKMPPFKPEFLHWMGFSYASPLKGTKYVADLDDKDIIGERDPRDEQWGFTEEDYKKFGNCTEKDTAEYSNIHMLTYLYDNNRKAYSKIRSCFTAALRDGIYEAATNLGIMSANMEGDEKKALYYFDIGIRHDIQSAMVNKIRMLYYLDLPKGAEYLVSMENHEPVCYELLYDLAVLYFYGSTMKNNTLRQDKDYAKKLLQRIIDNQKAAIKYDDTIVGNAINFLGAVDKTNIFTLKAEYVFFYMSNVFMLKCRRNESDMSLDHLSRELDRIMPLHGTKVEMHVENTPEGLQTGKLVIAYNDGEVMDFNSYTEVEPSAMGAWQAYLFYVSQKVVNGWQGLEGGRKYIFSHADLNEVLEESDIKIESQGDLIKWLSFNPQVTIDNDIATVICFYWARSEGLVRETATIKLSGKKIESINLAKS